MQGSKGQEQCEQERKQKAEGIAKDMNTGIWKSAEEEPRKENIDGSNHTSFWCGINEALK